MSAHMDARGDPKLYAAISLAAHFARRALARFGRSKSGDADDAVQEARIRVWKYASRFGHLEPPLIRRLSERAVTNLLALSEDCRHLPSTRAIKKPLKFWNIDEPTHFDKTLQRMVMEEVIERTQTKMSPKCRLVSQMIRSGRIPNRSLRTRLYQARKLLRQALKP